MFSKLAKQTGKWLPQARGGYQSVGFQYVRAMSAQAQTKHTKSGIELMAMKHVNELQTLGPLSKNLDSTIKRQVQQLQGMSLKEQAMYFESASQDWASLDNFVKEGIRAVTTEARDQMAARTPAEMAVDHAAILKSIDANTTSIDKAVWMVDLMLSERIKLNADQQEAYVAAMTKQFPDAINRLSTIQGIGLERSDFLQEVASLARNVAPTTKNMMDAEELHRSHNDMAYLKQLAIPYHFEDGSDFIDHELLVKNYGRQLREDQEREKPKAAACITRMRAIKDVSSLGEQELLRLTGDDLQQQKDKLSIAAGGDDAQLKKEMENFYYNSCLMMTLKKGSASVEEVKNLFPGAVDVFGSGQSFLIKFDNVEDLVSASECVDSDGNMSFDCVNYYYPVGNEVLLVESDGLLLCEKRRERWAVLHDIYFGKDRDLVNFPLIHYHEDNMKKLRYKLIPEFWFDAMYDKTGVSGPHFTLYALILFILSKQYFFLGVHQMETIGILILMPHLMLKYNKMVPVFYQKAALRLTDAKYDYTVTRAKQADIDHCRETVAQCKEQLAAMDVPSPAIEAMSENVDLQLEAEYRERLERVHQSVKKRLDYQVALSDAKRQFQAEHMTSWIIEQVNQSITPELQKSIMKQCFTDLATLSQKQQSQA